MSHAVLVASSQPQTSLTWEWINCPLCHASDEELVLQTHAQPGQTLYSLVRCRACGMVYMNPRPDEACISQFYPEDYAPYHRPSKQRVGWWGRTRRYLEQLVLSRRFGYPQPLRGWREKTLAYLAGPWFGPDRHSQTALPFQGEGRLLDYGCGSGCFAARMRDRGWTVTGMDFSPHAAEQARKRHGLDVLVGTLPHPKVRPESFDMVTLGAVLEHVHWPQQLIGSAVRVLRPGGVLVVSVPNFDSWGRRTFGANWWPLDIPLHLLHFTPATLCRLLGGYGLEVEEVRYQARASWMRKSFQRSAQRSRSWLRRLVGQVGQIRPVPSLVTAWSELVGQTDNLLVIARRPQRQAAAQPLLRAA